MKGRLSEQTIIEILNDPRSSLVVASDHGITSAMVRFIRTGKNYAHVHPEIPRCSHQSSLTCDQCLHWQQQRERCDLEFPDPKEIGLRFANWCAAFHDGSG